MAKRSGKFYRRNEAEIMEALGMEGVPGSGAGWINKEDGENDYIMAQLKSTDASSIKVAKLDIDKLEFNASVSHKLPVFIINFLQSDDIYLMVKPEDLVPVAKYLRTGSTEVPDNRNIVPEISAQPDRKRIGSGNKDSYWKQEQKKYQNKNTKRK